MNPNQLARRMREARARFARLVIATEVDAGLLSMMLAAENEYLHAALAVGEAAEKRKAKRAKP
ncbi:MAG: hypothetical protein ACLQJR_18410 [Stellaceae bacterium]